MITPAQRIEQVEEYYFSLKLKEIARMQQQGKPVINLGIGNPDQMPHHDVIDTLSREARQEHTHGYQPYMGIPRLREAFARWYREHYHTTLDPESEILPLMGSKEGIMHLSMAFLNPGDRVLVPNPGYPTYAAITRLLGARIVTYDLNELNNWQPDLEALQNQDLTGIKLMWVNYPNMPTGAPASRRLFERLVAFGRKNNILICNDNPYSFILNNNPMSLLSVPGAKETAIELNSLSKSHNMAGWRIGMAVSNAQFIQYILRVKSNMDSGMFRPLQEAAATALELNGNWYHDMNRVYARRRELACGILKTLNCSWDPNQTGMFIWAKTDPGGPPVKELTDELLYRAHVFITPGFIFGSNGSDHLRISLCTPEDKLKEAHDRIIQYKNLDR